MGRVIQSRGAPDPATFVGKGKVTELHDLVHSVDAEAVILDRRRSFMRGSTTAVTPGMSFVTRVGTGAV